ncbi:hypothetical protein C8Q77DRAFT_1077955 [Trametes polyzona]|nr:hypothetical protein C8Q77DRAFT_1077955 [Trametes polyzona]
MSDSLVSDDRAYRDSGVLDMRSLARDAVSLDQDTWYTLTHTSGAILMGGQIALFLSGAVFMQAILYHRMYPSDHRRIKAMVRALSGGGLQLDH